MNGFFISKCNRFVRLDNTPLSKGKYHLVMLIVSRLPKAISNESFQLDVIKVRQSLPDFRLCFKVYIPQNPRTTVIATYFCSLAILHQGIITVAKT